MVNTTLETIRRIGMIPVLNIDKAERAVNLAKALSKGGLPLMEVMFRTEDAAASIKNIADNVPDFLVGAGTVLSEDQVLKAIDSGAKFLVSPGFNPKVCKAAVKAGIPIVPGCTSPTEVEAARDLGLSVLKFFPAVQNGGVDAMALLSGPYPDVLFVPTGDLNFKLADEYLQFGKVAAAGGDYMLSYDDIHSNNFTQITADVLNTVLSYLNFHILKIEFNRDSVFASRDLSAVLGNLGLCFKGGLNGKDSLSPNESNGLIVIGTKDLFRSYYYLKRRGIEFEKDGDYDESFKDNIYFKRHVNGFRLRLAQD